jgi:hypothetical protein
MAIETDKTAREFEAMLHRCVKRSGTAGANCTCFDPDTATAYLERTLSEAARHRYEEHLAACSSCRHHLVELFRLRPQPSLVPAQAAASRKELLSFLARWFEALTWRSRMVAAATMGVVALAVLVTSLMMRRYEQIGVRSKVALTPVTATPEAIPTPGKFAQPERDRDREFKAAKQTAQSLGVKPTFRPRIAAHPKATSPMAASRVAPPTAPASAASALAKSIPMAERADALPRELAMISGTVNDSQGAGIPNVQVVLMDADSQQTRARTKTDPNGQFSFANVPRGSYLIQAWAPGFKVPQSLTVIVNLSGQANEQLVFKLEAGAVSESVAVANTKAAEKLDSQPPALPMGSLESGLPRLSPEVEKAKEVERRSEGKEVQAADAAQEQRSEYRLRNNAVTRALITEGPSATAARKERDRAVEKSRGAEKSLALMSKKVGNKTFRFEDGIWVDSRYKPEHKLPVIQLSYGSDEFKQVLAEIPALKHFFALAPVIVVWQGKAYEVKKEQ